jgi:hypothetical protein
MFYLHPIPPVLGRKGKKNAIIRDKEYGIGSGENTLRLSAFAVKYTSPSNPNTGRPYPLSPTPNC